MPGDRIIFGAAALPEPDRQWLAAAERLPIESIWQGGHVLPQQPTGEAVTRLALLTAWTERVRVGTAVLVLPLYHPVVVAKQIADLDAWSGGRVSIGIGVGGEFPHEFDAVGVPRGERGARTDEAMQVLRSLWSGAPTTHHGRFFDLDDVTLRPVVPPGACASAGRAGGPPLLVSG
ncbi:MAG TPA: LLM class flavin-dependent oxidoreductase, partial [Acidimicrobiales bacterium]|nr:LLM class flavin-dependent oxidoreductase [Acidimicrobiales bacterium]